VQCCLVLAPTSHPELDVESHPFTSLHMLQITRRAG
jgi:hypothetical protein